MSPFPFFDTEYVNEVKKKYEQIKTMNEKDQYDELPVTACKYCKSLHIITDDVENNICVKCGAINEIDVYENIYEYISKTNDKVY